MTNEGILSISEDGSELILTLKKYNETPIHVLEPDKHTVKKMRGDHVKCQNRDTAFLKTELELELKNNAENEDMHKS